MKIKAKLTLGVGLLFILIVLQAVVGIWFANNLKADSDNILQSNYNSLEYASEMMKINNFKGIEQSPAFKELLQKQLANITEPGEAKVSSILRKNYEEALKNPQDSILQSNIQNALFAIMDLNMQAIDRKSLQAKQTANSATYWIAIVSALSFMIAFILLINLPYYIANPISELTLSIEQIAAKNYAQRVHFQSHDEFGTLARSFNTMAEKLQEYNQSNLASVMNEKKRMEALVSNMHDPVVGLDENKRILFVNQEALQILGLKEPDVLGHPATEIALHNDLLRTLLSKLYGNLDQTDPKALKIYAQGKESFFEQDNIEITVIPTGEEQAKHIGHVMILRNVTIYKELDFAKTNFIATISHEFKTPIASIKMSLQLLENEKIGPLNSEQKHLLDSIREDTTRLLNITSELLDMTQAETGNIQLSIRPADPVEIVQYALEVCKNAAEQKGIKIQVVLPKYDCKVLADSEKTAWVMVNLLNNAIRYSPEQSNILVMLVDTANQVIFAVKDYGQGIAPQYKHKIFDRYFRIPGSGKEGTGLGLAISKAFIEAQGGTIEVDSEIGMGSTFSVRLPLAE
jgi:two-component system, NtrC family, sensor histidine kinase KinB